MKLWPFGGKWLVVAYDPGWSSKLSDTFKVHHHVTYSEHSRTGERRINVKSKDTLHKTYETHQGILKSKHMWERMGQLLITEEAMVYDHEFQPINPTSPSQVKEWHRNPVTKIGEILRLLEDSPEFVELRKHQLVEDAFGELETVIKMHEGMDVPS